jgi:hypothetical protein
MRTIAQTQLRSIALGVTLALAGVMPRAEAAQSNTCALIPAAEASQIIGSAVTERNVDTHRAGPRAAGICNYSTAPMQGGFILRVVHLRVMDLAREVASEKKQIRNSMSMLNITPKITDVSGLGNAAFLADCGGFMQLNVITNGDQIVIDRNARANKKVIAETEQLARTALSRLRGWR